MFSLRNSSLTVNLFFNYKGVGVANPLIPPTPRSANDQFLKFSGVPPPPPPQKKETNLSGAKYSNSSNVRTHSKYPGNAPEDDVKSF